VSFLAQSFVFAIVEVWFLVFGFWATGLSGGCVNISLAGSTVDVLLGVS